MPDWLADLLIKWGGATGGSVVAVLMRPGKDSLTRKGVRILAGTWVGGVSSGAVLEFLEWPMTHQMWLFVASALGVTGYLVLHAVLSVDYSAVLQSLAGKVGKK